MQRFDLKRFRIDRKLTQKELAELLMCKQNYISNIENGIKPISKGAEYDVPVLAKLPMDPALAAACDAGKIEYVENNYMKDAIEVLKKL